jgi:hypothetical protein
MKYDTIWLKCSFFSTAISSLPPSPLIQHNLLLSHKNFHIFFSSLGYKWLRFHLFLLLLSLLGDFFLACLFRVEMFKFLMKLFEKTKQKILLGKLKWQKQKMPPGPFRYEINVDIRLAIYVL